MIIFARFVCLLKARILMQKKISTTTDDPTRRREFFLFFLIFFPVAMRNYTSNTFAVFIRKPIAWIAFVVIILYPSPKIFS